MSDIVEGRLRKFLFFMLVILIIAVGMVGYLFGTKAGVSEGVSEPVSIVIVQEDPIKIIASLIQSKQSKIDPVIALEIAKAVKLSADEFQLPYAFVISVIDKESKFKPISISSKNCKGLMQIHKKYHEDKLKKFNIKGDELFYIYNNVRVGCAIFREYYNATGSITKTLAKYYGTSDTNYSYAILASFADLMIKHTTKEEEDGEREVDVKELGEFGQN